MGNEQGWEDRVDTQKQDNKGPPRIQVHLPLHEQSKRPGACLPVAGCRER